MRFELSNALDVKQFMAKSELLIKKGSTIEITEKQQPRTDNLARYAHLIINYFALNVGKTPEYVKKIYFKQHCNRDLFEVCTFDELLGIDVTTLRSAKELSKDELSIAIARFRTWSRWQHGIYLPTPEEKDLLLICESQTSKYKQYDKQ